MTRKLASEAMLAHQRTALGLDDGIRSRIRNPMSGANRTIERMWGIESRSLSASADSDWGVDPHLSECPPARAIAEMQAVTRGRPLPGRIHRRGAENAKETQRTLNYIFLCVLRASAVNPTPHGLARLSSSRPLLTSRRNSRGTLDQPSRPSSMARRIALGRLWHPKWRSQ